MEALNKHRVKVPGLFQGLTNSDKLKGFLGPQETGPVEQNNGLNIAEAFQQILAQEQTKQQGLLGLLSAPKQSAISQGVQGEIRGQGLGNPATSGLNQYYNNQVQNQNNQARLKQARRANINT